MATDRRFPEVPVSHPVLAQCGSEIEANAILDLLRKEGIAWIRLDREQASLRSGAPTATAVSILVSREDYSRARALLPEALPGAVVSSGEDA